MARHRSRRRNKRKTTRRRNRRQRGGADTCLFLSFPPKSGLGNLLFPYAAALKVNASLGEKLYLMPYTNDHSEKDYRKILFKQGTPIEDSDVKGRIATAKRILGNMNLESTQSHTVWEYTPTEDDKVKDIIMGDAYFQNYKCIESVIPDIRKQLANTFAELYSGFKDTIKPTSAFIHVRKGDYKDLLSLNNDYYNRGLASLDSASEVTDIYIVSDDIAWCKQQGWKSPKIRWFDNPEDMKDEVKTLYLMSLCLAGACISASTFSTWGAILGPDQNPKSTIIYPSSWITGRQSSELMFPERWTRVEGIQNVFTK